MIYGHVSFAVLPSAATEAVMPIRTTSSVRMRPALSLSAGIACLAALAAAVTASPAGATPGGGPARGPVRSGDSCLLYTSDAADE